MEKAIQTPEVDHVTVTACLRAMSAETIAVWLTCVLNMLSILLKMHVELIIHSSGSAYQAAADSMKLRSQSHIGRLDSVAGMSKAVTAESQAMLLHADCFW